MNIEYDNKEFFEKYSQMDRSKYGLAGAGEWHQLKNILPDLKNKSFLDLGCGYGWHCIYAAENGASSVVGVDISEKMLTVAKEKNNYKNVKYIKDDISKVKFENKKFDIVFSSLAIHYLESFEELVENINGYLKKDGTFIFTVEHPVFTAEGSQQWNYDRNGKILNFPVDNYFYEGKRTTNFLDTPVTKYHRTLTTYINGLIDNGFKINKLVEPTPPQELMNIPGMKDELRRPMMLIISATKIK